MNRRRIARGLNKSKVDSRKSRVEYMKIVHKNDAEILQISGNAVAVEYGGSQAIDGAVVELSGKYPDTGRVVNTKCQELIYVIRGLGVVVVEGRETPFDAGDTLLIESGERYFFDAKATLFIASAPAWYPEQHKTID